MPLSEERTLEIKEKRMELLRNLERDLPEFYLGVSEEILSKATQRLMIEGYKKIHLEATDLCQIILPLSEAEKAELKQLRERVNCLMRPIYFG